MLQEGLHKIMEEDSEQLRGKGESLKETNLSLVKGNIRGIKGQ